MEQVIILPALLTVAKLTSDAVWGYSSVLAFYGGCLETFKPVILFYLSTG